MLRATACAGGVSGSARAAGVGIGLADAVDTAPCMACGEDLAGFAGSARSVDSAACAISGIGVTANGED